MDAQGQGYQSPHLIVELPGTSGEVHGRQAPIQHGGIGVGIVVLRHTDGGTAFQLLHCLGQRVRAQLRQAGRQGLRVLVRVDSRLAAEDDVPASSSLAIYIMVTPVTLSPLRMAQLMGAAPRYFGRMDECTLIEP